MTDNTEIAALVGSRICHDLISPVGAIGNGLELIGLTGGAAGPELDLISDSVSNASARIRFFRIAFGLCSTGQQIGASEIHSVLDGIATGARIAFAWTVQGDVARPALRLAFLALMCAETAMPYGGLVSISRESAAWSIHATAGKLRIDPPLWAALDQTRAPAAVTPAHVQFALLPLVAQELERRISVDIEDTRLALHF